MRQFSRTGVDYQRLIDARTRAIALLDPSLRFEDCNAVGAQLFGCTREAMRGRGAADFLPPTQPGGEDSHVAMLQAAHGALAGIPQTMLAKLIDARGAPLDTIVQFEGIVLDGQPRILARVRDISRWRYAERALSESEERLRQVLENTSAVVFIKDPDGRYVFVNRRFCLMFGRTQEELQTLRDADIFPPEVAEQLRADDRRVFQLRAAQEIEEALIVNGQPCTYLAIKFPLLNATGEPYAICGIATDITGRKRSEAALRSAALAVSTAEGDVLFQELTRYLATTLGVDCAFIARCDPGLAKARTLSVYVGDHFEENFDYALPGTMCGTVVGQAFRYVPENIRAVYPDDPMFERLRIEGYAAYPLTDSAGRSLGLIAVLSRFPLGDANLTESMLKIFAARAAAEIERQATEEARRTSEASYQAIFEAAEDAIFVHHWDTGALVDVNPKASSVYGYTAEEMKRLAVGDVSSNVHPYTHDEAIRLIERAKTDGPVRFQWHRRNRDGSLHWDEVCLKPAIIGGERRVLGFSREITERKRAEDALRNAALAVSAVEGERVHEDLVRQLCETLSLDLAFIAVFPDGDGEQLRALAMWRDGAPFPSHVYRLRGTPCETVVGHAFRAYPEKVRERFPHDGTWPFEAESYAAFPLFDREGRPLGLIGVVDRKPMGDTALIESVLKIFAARAVAELNQRRAADDLRESEAQYRAIFAASMDGMVVLDGAACIVDANPAFLTLLGYARGELLGRRLDEVVLSEHGDDCAELTRNVMRGLACQRECRARRRDGEVVDLEVRGARMHDRGQAAFLAIVRDITAHKRSEAERAGLEAQLRQAQKMEAIGHLAGGIAHDFNNILTSIMGYLVLATERQVDIGDAKLGKYLDQAQLAAARARDLIRQMLTFSRGQRGERRPMALPPLIRESVKLLRSTLPSSVKINTEFADGLPAVLVDAVQIDQVLMNLCINARDAMQGSGTIDIAVRAAGPIDCVCASCRKAVKSAQALEIVVRDTGAGIAPQVLERMFEPFFSTKEVGQGSGMGLSTVHGIVHEHGGHLAVESALGRGTTFRILLEPVADQPARLRASWHRPRGVASAERLSGRVLLVEDEPMVAQFMAELLGGWGLQVVVREDGASALQAIDEAPACEVLITDFTMPGMTGLELARRVSALRPDLPIVLYTGYGADLQQSELERCGVRATLPKPVEPEALHALLREALGAAHTTMS